MIELGPFAVSGFLVVLLLRYLILPRLEKWVMTGEWFEQIVRLISHAVDKVARTGSPSKSGRKYIESEYQKLPLVKSRKDK